MSRGGENRRRRRGGGGTVYVAARYARTGTETGGEDGERVGWFRTLLAEEAKIDFRYRPRE